MGVALDLRIAARRWMASRGAPKPTAECAAERAELKRWFDGARVSAAGAGATDARLLEIEAAALPWTDTGIDLREGEWVSTFAAGRVVLSDPLDLWVGPQFQLWMRVGENGQVFNGRRDSHSFRAFRLGVFTCRDIFPGSGAIATVACRRR